MRRSSPAPNANAVPAAKEGNNGAALASSTPPSSKPLRPSVDQDAADEEILDMMTRCWSEDPLDRPDFSALKVTIRKLNK